MGSILGGFSSFRESRGSFADASFDASFDALPGLLLSAAAVSAAAAPAAATVQASALSPATPQLRPSELSSLELSSKRSLLLLKPLVKGPEPPPPPRDHLDPSDAHAAQGAPRGSGSAAAKAAAKAGNARAGDAKAGDALAAVAAVAAAVPKRRASALLGGLFGLGGGLAPVPPPLVTDNWQPRGGAPLREWGGVELDRDGARVASLALKTCGVAGDVAAKDSFQPFMASCAATLTTLDLGGNPNLTGPLVMRICCFFELPVDFPCAIAKNES
jgi:hypothetical protein